MAEENNNTAVAMAPANDGETIEQLLARQEAAERAKQREPLLIFNAMIRGYSDIANLFGPYGSRSRSLRFTDSGVCRVCATIGWIIGIASAGKEEEAEKLARYFLRELDFLATYGAGPVTTDYLLREGKNGEPDKYLEVPPFLVQLTDDGCPHSFGISWYRFDRVLKPKEEPGERCIDSGGTYPCAYRYSMNGGLIFHGSGVETFAVRLCHSDNPWSIHT